MPELPEVQTVVNRLEPIVVGCKIKKFWSLWPRQVIPSIALLERGVLGKKIIELNRRGKYIIFLLSDHAYMIVHLGMSGRLEWENQGGSNLDHKHMRACWQMQSKGRLVFIDPRKFGRIWYASHLDQVCGRLGLEPLESSFTPDRFVESLGRHKRQLKPLLLSQSVVAGLGNIYVDEALFRSRLHPTTCSSSLTKPQIKRLHRVIIQVLQEAVERCGTSFDWAYPGGSMQHHLQVYGRSGKKCYRCKGVISRTIVGQRSTHYCPHCQPEPA